MGVSYKFDHEIRSKVIFVSKVVMLSLLLTFSNLFVLFAGDVGPYDDNKGYD